MSGLLEGKVCIVTGGARGIGRAVSCQFAENGATVYVNGVREGGADEWIAEFNRASGRAALRAAYFDVGDEASARSAVMAIRREAEHIDVLVNNAGVEYNELIGMISRDHMEDMFRVNVYGTIYMLQLTSRIMARQKTGGSIINISSMVGLRGNRGQLVYSATKGAVISLTRSAAKELASKGVRVNSIAPGLTRTEMMEQADEEKLRRRIENISMGRLAEPADIAKACLFFASDLSEYVSGQVLAVDGCTIM